MHELPNERLKRYTDDLKISLHTAKILANSKKISDYFEDSLKYYDSPIEVSNWIVNELLTKINEMEKSDTNKGNSIQLSSKMSPSFIANMAKLMSEKGLNRNLAREIFDKSFHTGRDPYAIVMDMDVEKISDSEEIINLINNIIEKQPQLAEQSKTNPNVINFILGLVMKSTKGRANPQITLDLIKEIVFSVQK